MQKAKSAQALALAEEIKSAGENQLLIETIGDTILRGSNTVGSDRIISRYRNTTTKDLIEELIRVFGKEQIYLNNYESYKQVLELDKNTKITIFTMRIQRGMIALIEKHPPIKQQAISQLLCHNPVSTTEIQNFINHPHGILLLCGSSIRALSETYHTIIEEVATFHSRVFSTTNLSPTLTQESLANYIEIKPDGIKSHEAILAAQNLAPNLIGIHDANSHETAAQMLNAASRGIPIIAAISGIDAPRGIFRLEAAGACKQTLLQCLTLIVSIYEFTNQKTNKPLLLAEALPINNNVRSIFNRQHANEDILRQTIRVKPALIKQLQEGTIDEVEARKILPDILPQIERSSQPEYISRLNKQIHLNKGWENAISIAWSLLNTDNHEDHWLSEAATLLACILYYAAENPQSPEHIFTDIIDMIRSKDARDSTLKEIENQTSSERVKSNTRRFMNTYTPSKQTKIINIIPKITPDLTPY